MISSETRTAKPFNDLYGCTDRHLKHTTYDRHTANAVEYIKETRYATRERCPISAMLSRFGSQTRTNGNYHCAGLGSEWSCKPCLLYSQLHFYRVRPTVSLTMCASGACGHTQQFSSNISYSQVKIVTNNMQSHPRSL